MGRNPNKHTKITLDLATEINKILEDTNERGYSI